MKDGLGRATVERLGANVARGAPGFDVRGFVAQAVRGLDGLELKQRVAHVTDALGAHLPASYPQAVALLVRAAAAWDRGAAGDPLGGFAAWPMFHFIETRGGEHFEPSMAALHRLTALFSGEFAVRPFLRRYPEPGFARLEQWATDPDEHVRRLASEGARPRLPWAQRLPQLQRDPSPVLAVLELLKDDPSPYVRRSVANNLADIAKDHPDRVAELCKRWMAGASDERTWIVRRATRNLVKAGHPAVWSLLGYTESPRVRVDSLQVSPSRIELGDDLRIAFRIRSTASSLQRLVVDYAVHHVKANGATAAKVFKLKDVSLGPRESMAIAKSHPFRVVSTRAYYPGTHRIEVLVNGTGHDIAEFDLVCERRAQRTAGRA